MYLSVAAKLLLNVHDLNNEGSVGNSTDIRQIRMIKEDGVTPLELPAVSGRMMKHWHLGHMLRAEGTQTSPVLCQACQTWEPERKPDDELSGLENCVICDAHGFLNADPGKSLRRSSCVNLSWLLPVLGTEQTSKQVIHSRVASNAGEEDTSQMIFNKTYASGVYGFVCSIDLGRIGKPLTEDGIEAEEITRRRKLAVQALLPICVGAFGASQSHALPHARCLGLLAALSTTAKPIPNLVSPIYAKGFEESISLVKAVKDAHLCGFSADDEEWVQKLGDHKKDNVQAVFDAVLTQLEA